MICTILFALLSISPAVEPLEETVDTSRLIKDLCIQADQAIDEGNDAKAIELYNRCSDLTPFSEPMFTLSSSLYDIAKIYFYNGENDKAQEYILKSINIDENRGTDSILALRYMLAAEVAFEKGDYTEALAFVEKGKQCSIKKKNNNVTARLMLIAARCREAISGPNPDWQLIEQEYRLAFETLNKMCSAYYYGAVNPFAPEFLYRIACAVDAQGKDATQNYKDAITAARVSQKMRGVNPVVDLESCQALVKIYTKQGNEQEAEKYSREVERLSYVPYVRNMGNKLSLSQMEFIRREKEREIEKRKDQALYMLIIASVLALAFISLLLMYRYQVRQKKQIEQKNAQLVKLGLQKDKLISMVEDPTHDTSELSTIANDKVPFPEISLSKRETEVLALCCEGLISKEIAAKLNVSVRTVESHKFNLCRKVGVNTTNELIAFAFKTGRIK